MHFYCTKSINPLFCFTVCHDHYGNCKDVGDTYYECDVGGNTQYGCSCSMKGGDACNSYEKDYKQPSGYDLYGPSYGEILGYGGGTPPPPSGDYGGAPAPPPGDYGSTPPVPNDYVQPPQPSY